MDRKPSVELTFASREEVLTVRSTASTQHCCRVAINPVVTSAHDEDTRSMDEPAEPGIVGREEGRSRRRTESRFTASCSPRSMRNPDLLWSPPAHQCCRGGSACRLELELEAGALASNAFPTEC
ncbi:hypothetical protein AAFF_G00034360 [Aldrovandia affinis]|uniref:Uncharacterized protein n=1 Tax=Aldrovandia affinis TaxID=143900 RepID=A0AAD7WGL6_9TELE|nr:hypothetical protein AAFF_G00034360 [Aldrovandia affinis]